MFLEREILPSTGITFRKAAECVVDAISTTTLSMWNVADESSPYGFKRKRGIVAPA